MSTKPSPVPVYLNDLLQLTEEEIRNCKIKFNMSNGVENPIEIYRNDPSLLLTWQFWGHKRRTFYKGQIAIGLVRIHGSRWLLFDISRILRYSKEKQAVAYEYEPIERFRKYFGRLVLHYKFKGQTISRLASSCIEDIEVVKLLESKFDDDLFPGYDKVLLTWPALRRVLPKTAWRTALSNQKAIYLITDRSNGKQYVGSASGKDMLYQRWKNYADSGHGTNKELIKLSPEHIKDNFQYSILEIFKSTTPKDIILTRESFWKKALLSKPFGYNLK